VPAPPRLYQQVESRIKAVAAPAGVRVTSVRRLALLATGILAARSCVLRQVAAELDGLGLTAAGPEGIARRLRRTLDDPRLAAGALYAPAVRGAVAWPRPGSGRAVVAVDESSQDGRVHLLRASLAYRGGSLPLAWAVWAQNAPLPEGRYWAELEAVLAQVAALVPPGVEVVVVADRAYDVPAFVDRVAARGWHWVVRCKARGTLRFRDRLGRAAPLAAVLGRHVAAPGRRWKGRGAVFKKAGWREASVVAAWAPGEAEPLVVLTDLPPRWSALRTYARRFWIEPGFRADKGKGWRWEESRVPGPARQARLLLGMAWASLVALCLGAEEAGRRLAALAGRAAAGRRLGRPRPARDSLVTLGVRRARAWLYGTAAGGLPWRLPAPTAPSWTEEWSQHQLALRLRQTVPS
jgi:hypothetical protein